MTLSRDKEGFIDSPIYCNHANEVPWRCSCDGDCYCKAHTCKARNSGLSDHEPKGIPRLCNQTEPVQQILYSQMKPYGGCKSDGEDGCAVHRIFNPDCAFQHDNTPPGSVWIHLGCPVCYTGSFAVQVKDGAPDTRYHMANCSHCGQRFRCVDVAKNAGSETHLG